jgi:dephospho-CoA kinase
MVIIGITGTLGAGKGTVVEYLVKERGFRHYSVRAFLLEKIRELGMPENRDSMLAVGNRLRAEHGSSYAVDQLFLRALEAGGNAVIESVRTTGEVASLRQKGQFILLAIDADPQIRYERIVIRNSETRATRIDLRRTRSPKPSGVHQTCRLSPCEQRNA